MNLKSNTSAYITGVAIGDGNLSNPNGRATRLRITCDDKYPRIISNIAMSLGEIFPNNKVSVFKRKSNCSDVSVYSNKLECFLGWKANSGPKHKQDVRVPSWIFFDKSYVKSCLRGLIETDGSVYSDRNYRYINFTTVMHGLSRDVQIMISLLGYESNTQMIMQKTGNWKFITRVSKKSDSFIDEVGISK